METLEAIFQRFACAPDDPGTGTGTDKTTRHAYGPIYARLFEASREDAIHLVELGVDSGASAVAWAEYFPNSQVTGLDITLANVRHRHPRVRLLQADATRAVSDPEVPDPIDVVIDDASHRHEDQLAALAAWGPRARRMMVIEDVAAPSLDSFEYLSTKLGMTMEVHDLRGITDRFDDCLLVFFQN